MLAAAFGALAGSVVTALLIGYAFVAPKESFLKTKRGVWLLVFLGISFLPLPPQVAAMDKAALPLADVLGQTGASAFTWPAGMSKTTYLVLWAVLTLLGLLVGSRIWKIGTPEWRGTSNVLWDSSAASRIKGLLPIADSLADVLDTISRARLSAREAPQVAVEVRNAGRRFGDELPEKSGDVYRLVAEGLPADVASLVTGYLLEGAGRRGAGPPGGR